MDDRRRVEEIVERLRGAGLFVRLTEWFDGFQCGAVSRSDTRVAFFSGWHATELAAWEEVLGAVIAWQERR